MNWNYDNIVPPEQAEPVTPTAVVPVSGPTPGPETGPKTMTQDEIAAVGAIIQSYNGYPGVSSAFANMVAANSTNPERLTALVREMVDQIEQVKSNPHAHYPVNAEIAATIEAIRKVELEKPDPLNLLRGNETAGQTNNTNVLSGVVAVVGGLVAAAATTQELPYGVTAERMEVKHLGKNEEVIALMGLKGGFTPTPGLPDVRQQGQSQGINT